MCSAAALHSGRDSGGGSVLVLSAETSVSFPKSLISMCAMVGKEWQGLLGGGSHDAHTVPDHREAVHPLWRCVTSTHILCNHCPVLHTALKSVTHCQIRVIK